MKIKQLKKQTDLLLATFLLLTSLLGSVFFYGELFSQAEASSSPLPAISPGKRSLGVFYQNSCAGIIQTEFKEGKLFELYLGGKILTRQFGNTKAVDLMGRALFNPLGQMIQSTLNVQSLPASLSLSAANVNPILLDIDAKNPSGAYQRQLSFPGPVSLRKSNSKEQYFLVYPHASELNTRNQLSPFALLLAPLASSLRISEEGVESACADENLSPIDLSLIAAAVQSLLSQQKLGLRPQ